MVVPNWMCFPIKDYWLCLMIRVCQLMKIMLWVCQDVKERMWIKFFLILIFYYYLVKILLNTKSLLCTLDEGVCIPYLLEWIINVLSPYFKGSTLHWHVPSIFYLLLVYLVRTHNMEYKILYVKIPTNYTLNSSHRTFHVHKCDYDVDKKTSIIRRWINN